jgi:hypothetical protein
MEAVKGTISEGLYERLAVTPWRHNLQWNKLTGAITDGLPNLKGKTRGILKWMHGIRDETCPDQGMLFLRYIIHQDVLSRTVSNMNHATKIQLRTCKFHNTRTRSEPETVRIPCRKW